MKTLRCPKCGLNDERFTENAPQLKASFFKTGEEHADCVEAGCVPPDEHLHVGCGRCKHFWSQPPLDALPPHPPEAI